MYNLSFSKQEWSYVLRFILEHLIDLFQSTHINLPHFKKGYTVFHFGNIPQFINRYLREGRLVCLQFMGCNNAQ